MNEKKCPECGEMFAAKLNECPKCGCPVEASNALSITPSVTSKRNKYPIVSIIIGIIIIAMGVFVMTQKPGMNAYSAKTYDAEYAAFGGDFYTEIYGASDIIVDELNDINGAMEIMSASVNTVKETINFSIGMLIIAIGLATISISCITIKRD